MKMKCRGLFNARQALGFGNVKDLTVLAADIRRQVGREIAD
jgi:hypothetical protein